MKKLTKFDVILNLWISLIINVALSIVLPALNGFLTWGSFLSGFAIAYPVSTIFVFIVPVVAWGGRFAALFGLKPNTPLVYRRVDRCPGAHNGHVYDPCS